MTQGPLAPDEVVVTNFSGRESISHPFAFEIEFVSTQLDLKPGKMIGTEVSIEIDRRDREAKALTPRYFHGYISRFAAGDVMLKASSLHKYRHYRAEMVPWLWFLTHTARCFLFFPEKEEKTILEVIEAVVNRAKSELHVNPVADLGGIGELAARKVKHCVQYRETDFNFLSRTLERYGAFYYFRFENGKHTLVVELKKNYPPCAEAEVAFPRVTGGQPTGDHITDWRHDYEFVSGKWSHTDYNYEIPSTSLLVNAPKLPAVDLPPATKYEIYDYPGDYALKGDGDKDARIHQEEREAQHSVINGSSTCRTLTPGHKFTLKTHPGDDVVSEHGKAYLVTAVHHAAQQATDETDDVATSTYSNRFTCVPDAVQFRPERRTPQPLISGVQTAVVVGPPGEEIYTDKLGRVKVQFHWDRIGKRDQDSSCWIRVSHPWAGKGWGAIAIPRIGQEVVVEFLEGDPDQPLITGRVYNAEQRVPYALPAEQTKSTMKSDSSKGSGGWNEFRFEDKKGSEQIWMHGEKDLDIEIKNDRRETIGKNRSLTVGANRTESVADNYHLKVGAANATEVGGDLHLKVKGDSNLDTGMQHSIKTGMDMVLDAGMNITEKAGMQIYIKAGMSVVIEGGLDVTLKGPGGFVNVGPAGVTIQGTMVLINSGGAPGSASEVSAKSPKAPEKPAKATDTP
jgi:type VI secretion system secreted protein VgrG